MPTGSPDPLSTSLSNPSPALQFDRVEPAAASATGPAVLQPVAAVQSCLVCRRPIQSTYFAVGDKIICPNCAAMIRSGPAGNPAGRFGKALLFGIGAAIVGAVVWGAILYFTHYQVGYVALLVGYMVGKSIKKGSGGRGGAGYQIMAVLLTYLVAAAANFPTFFEDFSRRGTQPMPAIILMSAFAALIAPVYVGAKSPILLFILGIALWEAWKFTKFVPIPLSGPYQIAPVSRPIPLSPLPDAASAPPPGTGVIL